MKKLLLAIVFSIAVCSIPAFAHHPAEDNDNMPEGTWDEINDNLIEAESPHLDLDLSLMGGTSSDMDAGSDDPMSQPTDADLDRIQAGAQESEQTESQEEASEDNSDIDAPGENQEQVVHYRPGVPGVAVDEELDPVQTETNFRDEVTTPTAEDEEGIVKLYAGDKVKIASELMVDDKDVGKSAECLVVAQAQENVEAKVFTFKLAKNGWEEWDGNFDELTGQKCELGKLHKITAYEGEVAPGEFKFYFGYQCDDGGLVANPEPLKFSVK